MSEKQDPTVVVSLTVKNVVAALEFYEKAFGAKEVLRMPMPDGSIGHAEFLIGNTCFYISTEFPEWRAFPMDEDQTASCLFGINSENCDEAFQKAVDAGAEVIDEPKDQIWGLRTSIVRDPFGYRWNLRHLIEDLSLEEIMDRAKKLMGG